MTITDSKRGRFKVISSDIVTVIDAFYEIMDYLSDNGINKESIIQLDMTNKLAVIKLN